jgi:hypothetical protein
MCIVPLMNKLNGLELSIYNKISVGGLCAHFNEVLQWSAVFPFQSLAILQSLEYSRTLDFKGFAAKHISIDEILLLMEKRVLMGSLLLKKISSINEVKSINILSSINVEYMNMYYCIELHGMV